jgi:hypothetical protein
MYLSYERIAATDVVKDVDDLTIPGTAAGAMIQAAGRDVLYTMDGTTDPVSDGMTGMVLRMTDPPFQVLIEDLVRIKFCRSGGRDGYLNLHYFGGH